MPQQLPGIIFDTLTRKSSVTSTLTAKKKRRKTRENDVRQIEVISPYSLKQELDSHPNDSKV
jgi:hypothetical protein